MLLQLTRSKLLRFSFLVFVNSFLTGVTCYAGETNPEVKLEIQFKSAILNENVAQIKKIVSDGWPLNKKGLAPFLGHTLKWLPLTFSAAYGKLISMQALISLGAQPSGWLPPTGEEALHIADRKSVV